MRRVAAGDQSHHLLLARREAVELVRRGGGLAGHGAERVEHEPREPRREHRVPFGDGAHGVAHLAARRALGDVAARPGPDHPHDVGRRIGDAQGEEPRRGRSRPSDHGLAVVPHRCGAPRRAGRRRGDDDSRHPAHDRAPHGGGPVPRRRCRRTGPADPAELPRRGLGGRR
ncbi:unnamed protein product, partial [Penicillium discolor]